MKTNQEIKTEARQLAARGSQYLDAQRPTGVDITPASDRRVLFTFPATMAPAGNERHIEAAIVGSALVFQLMERETDLPNVNREREGTLLASSPSAYDVLSTGYEMAEEERLGQALEPYAERSEETLDPADGETVANVETILESKNLTPVDRLRTKAEIVEFLEGRLEPGELITRNIERQCFREHQAERHDLKLTVGEP